MQPSGDITFDGWTLHAASGELEKDGRRVRLQEQPAQILKALLASPGQVVTREHLIDRLWPKGVIDFDTGLNTAVRKLRAALGDLADTPRYIETLPRKGYRFIATLDAAAPAARGVAPVANSLAVLPFKPLLQEGGNPALELGMADTLITQLSNLPGVKISPLSSVRSFNAVSQDPLAAGRALKVAAVLDGSIQTNHQRIRVRARLLNVSDGSALWAGQFDESMDDIFGVQDAIASQVVRALAVTLSAPAQQRMHRQSTANAEAYQAYVSGLYKWQRRSPQAVLDFEAALRADPGYALAWCGLSSSLTAQAVFGQAPPDEVFPRAKEAAIRAISLDGELSLAHAALGHVLVQHERRYTEAEQLYLTAIRLREDYAPQWQRLGILHAYLGRIDEALEDMQRAQSIEPTTLSISVNMGVVLYYSRAYDAALAHLKRVLQLDAHYDHARALMGKVLLAKGDIDGALAHLMARSQTTPGGDGDLGRAYARAGRVAEARAEIERLNERGRQGFGVAYDLATIHIALGEMQAACAALERALTDGSQTVGFLRLDPAIDPLRGDSCYARVERALYGG